MHFALVLKNGKWTVACGCPPKKVAVRYSPNLYIVTCLKCKKTLAYREQIKKNSSPFLNAV
jgi:hypothetical protein